MKKAHRVKNNLRKAVLVSLMASMLMAFQCEEEFLGGPFVYNQTKVSLSEGPAFSVGDTLWISGEVSSMIFDEGLQDSVMNPDESVSDVISVLRMRSQTGPSNTLEAISEFGLVRRIGGIDFLGACPESELIAIAPLTENGQGFAYEIGLVARNSGDFVLSWVNPADLQNSDLNVQLLSRYPIDGDDNALGLTRCGITSTRLNVSGTRREFFFSVQ